MSNEKAKVFLPKRKHQENIKHLLRQIRMPEITPETIMLNGQEAGDFALNYLRKRAFYNYDRRKQSTNKQRGRPKKQQSQEQITQKSDKKKPQQQHVFSTSNHDADEDALRPVRGTTQCMQSEHFADWSIVGIGSGC